MRALVRTGLPGGRRELVLELGSTRVVVTEVPGGSLTDREWRDVQLARLSFVAMWGDLGTMFDHDRFDGRGDDGAIYDARHYLARIEDGAGGGKLVTGRKVLLRPAALTAAQRDEPGHLHPLDIRYWYDWTTGSPLWPSLRDYARALAPSDELAPLRIASMGRVATHPFGERGRTPRQRERAAVAWAATQILAAHEDTTLLWIWTIRPEFRDKVMIVRDVDRKEIRPRFMRTDELLDRPAGSLRLNRGLPEVEHHTVVAPGYFMDNGSAAEVLADLLGEGRVSIDDLRPAIGRQVEWEAGTGLGRERLDELLTAITMPDHARLAELLTTPRSMKYLVPLLTGVERLSRMSSAEFRARFLQEVADGPFSACVFPHVWATEAWSMLEAVALKYDGEDRSAGPAPRSDSGLVASLRTP